MVRVSPETALIIKTTAAEIKEKIIQGKNS
jgi:hypothetical protein